MAYIILLGIIKLQAFFKLVVKFVGRGLNIYNESAATYLHTHNQLLQDIQQFSITGFEELIVAFSENALTDIATSITNTLSVAIDQAEEKDLDYQQALSEINAEINDFRNKI